MIKLLINIITFLISLIEKIEYRNYDFTDDPEGLNKIVNSVVPDDPVFIKSDSGLVPIMALHVTKPYQIYKVITDNGKFLECADEHLIFNENLEKVYVKDVKVGDFIMTDDGPSRVTHVDTNNMKVSMVDATISHPNHRYYTNGILSHNTIVSATFLVWYLIFHSEKNALVVGDVSDTTKELLEKMRNVILNLPFWMKPGLTVDNVMYMKFENGSRIIGRTTTKKTGIGFTINLLFMDEFAHIDASYLNFFYRSIYPTIEADPNSKIVITSTPNGTNRFYKIWQKAIEAENGFKPMRVDWWQIPGRTEEWKRVTIANLGTAEDFKQEYGLQFFAGDDLLLNSIDLKKMDNMKTKFENFPVDSLYMEDGDFRSYLKFHPEFIKKHLNEESNLKRDNSHYIISVDSGDGVGKDFSVINIYKLTPLPLNILKKHRSSVKNENDIFSLLQVGSFRTNKLNIDKFSKVANALIYNFFNLDNVRVVLELNHKGEIIHNYIKSHGEYFAGLLVHSKHTISAKYYSPGIILNSFKAKMKYCELFRHYLSLDRILPMEYLTVEELSGFGKTDGSNSFRSQLGNDDLAITSINATSFFQSPQFYEFCEDAYDKIMDEAYLKCIENDFFEYNRIVDNQDRAFDMGYISDLNNMMN